MSFSLPSSDVVILDAPETKGFDATFVYNFFVPDESQNDSGVASKFDDASSNAFRRTVARFVKFTFTPVRITRSSPGGVLLPDHTNPRDPLSIVENYSKIQREDDFVRGKFVGLEFQDDNVDGKLFAIVSGAVARQASSFNKSVEDDIKNQATFVKEALQSEHSLFDAAKSFATTLPEDVSKNVVVNALQNIDALQLSFVNHEQQVAQVNTTFQRVRDVSVRVQLSSRVAGDLIHSIVNDPSSIYADEMARVLSKFESRQKSFSNFDAAAVEESDYDVGFNAILLKKRVVLNTSAQSTAFVVGYVIEKHEMLSDGTLFEHPPIIIENASANVAVDTRVAYGRTYVYAIRTVVQLETSTFDEKGNAVTAVGLVSSRCSPRVFVACVETIPPLPPYDFDVRWDRGRQTPLLTWSFPPNSQLDIKRFQIFRRESIEKPFELMQVIDFDDSLQRIEGGERPDPALVLKTQGPMTTFLDVDFDRKKSYIYAVCCVDAHGLSSAYSVQFKVKFDSSKNILRKTLISSSGAPKSYPNMFLNQDAFVDTMRVSGLTRLKVFFDPEYLQVIDANGNDLRLLATNNDGVSKYRMQLLNIDVQRQEILDIKIQDRRNARK